MESFADMLGPVAEYLERLAGPVRLPFAVAASVRKIEDHIGDALDAAAATTNDALVIRATSWLPVS